MDRSTATYHSVTVNDFTVVITEFKPKAKKEKPPKKEKGGGGGGSSSNGSPSGPADLNKSDSSNGGGRLDEDQDTKRGKLYSYRHEHHLNGDFHLFLCWQKVPHCSQAKRPRILMIKPTKNVLFKKMRCLRGMFYAV